MAKPRWCVPAIIAVLLSVLVAPPAAAEDGPINNPIPEDPVASQLALTLTEYASFPKSEPVPPTTDPRIKRHARINYLGEVPDGSGRMFVPDLNGMLYLVKNRSPQPYLDVAAAAGPNFWSHRGIGNGFGFVTFHPDFKRNGKFYTVHSEGRDALTTKTPDLPPQPTPSVQGVITEWTTADPAANTFSGTHREVLRLAFRNLWHGLQEINFNPTAKRGDPDYGLLYVAVGDGGGGLSAPYPQDIGTAYGKILRIDPLGTDGANGRYGIPKQNPFYGRPGALREVYAYGLRNPHRFSWDPQVTVDAEGPGRPRLRHRMYLGVIGEHNAETIYEVKAGDNFGWPKREGPFALKDPDPTAASTRCRRTTPSTATPTRSPRTTTTARRERRRAPTRATA